MELALLLQTYHQLDNGTDLAIVYSKFLQYAWSNDFCFPGQERLAEEIGCTRVRVTQFVKELQEQGLVEVTRRGQGKTNVYRLHFRVKSQKMK